MPISNNKPAPPSQAPRSSGASQVAPRGGWPAPAKKADPKLGSAPGGVTPGRPVDYKTHALIGRREADGHLLLLENWPYCPTQDEIKAACKDTKYPYVQFAIVAVTGFWDTVEKETKPLWP